MMFSMKGSTCKACGTKFHICSSCGHWLEFDLYPLFGGYCCWECQLKDDPSAWDKYREDAEWDEDEWYATYDEYLAAMEKWEKERAAKARAGKSVKVRAVVGETNIETKTVDDPWPDVGIDLGSCIVHRVPYPVGTRLKVTYEVMDDEED